MYTLNFPSKKSAISSCAAPNCTCQEKQFSHTSDTRPANPSGGLAHSIMHAALSSRRLPASKAGAPLMPLNPTPDQILNLQLYV